MTDKQFEVIELMKKLGSKGHIVNAGSAVRVSLPFSEDLNPNITVWPNGSWHDFSNPSHLAQWEAIGLKDHGYVKDLQDAIKNRFPKMWAELKKPLPGSSAAEYITNRGLSGDIRMYRGSLAFPIYNEIGEIVGIQTRRIDGQEPKNLMVHGSDGKNGLFIRDMDHGAMPIVICEGATDTYTWVSGCHTIGALSASMLDGVKKWLALNRENYPYFVLALDADDAGRDAQSKLLDYMLGIGIARDRIKVMEHGHGKDLNDEMNNHHRLEIADLDEVKTDLFVKVVDEVNNVDEASNDMRKALWVGFFPPDFPGVDHASYPSGNYALYVFPESYGRAEVNKLMWKLKQSAYILRGW